MTPEERALLQTIGTSLLVRNLFTTFGVSCLCYGEKLRRFSFLGTQTALPSGILAPLCAVIILSLFKSERPSYLSRAMLGISVMSWIAFSVSMALEIASVFQIFDIFKVSDLDLTDRLEVVNARNFKLDLGADWLAYCFPFENRDQPLLNDLIITWRAWILAGRQRWVLYISMVLWVGSLGTTLGWLSLDTARPDILSADPNIYNDLLTISIFLSFGTNMLATSYIGYRLWHYQKSIRGLGQLRHLFTVWRTLLLLVESGVIYGTFQVVVAIMDVTPFYTNSAVIVFYVLQSILTSFSLAYPTLTVGIIRGPFSLVHVQETVVELRSSGEEARVGDPDATASTM
ncbi:hypothetical protein H0H92_007148 [Tricholoma furcatifolium]|nr:hypothetical protein H0H92_007148 [Tricholoma furcatifolium]